MTRCQSLRANSDSLTVDVVYHIRYSQVVMYRELRKIRTDWGITLSQLSAMTGIAQPNLSRIEGGRVDARYSTLARIARVLGVKPVLSSPTVMTMSDVKLRMDEGRQRLAEHGIHIRDAEQRLAWKQSRGVDTAVERRLLG